MDLHSLFPSLPAYVNPASMLRSEGGREKKKRNVRVWEGSVREAELSEVENQPVTSLISVLSGSPHPFGTLERFPACVIECAFTNGREYGSSRRSGNKKALFFAQMSC